MCIHDSRVYNFHESVVIGIWRTLLSFLFLSCTLSLGSWRMAGTLQMRCQDSDSHNESFQRLVATVSPYSARVHFVTLDWESNIWTFYCTRIQFPLNPLSHWRNVIISYHHIPIKVTKWRKHRLLGQGYDMEITYNQR